VSDKALAIAYCRGLSPIGTGFATSWVKYRKDYFRMELKLSQCFQLQPPEPAFEISPSISTEKMRLTDDQQVALEAMMSGGNVFLTGEAGTGKSTVLREFIRRCERDCIVLAPTGIAALNAGGTTIHSQMLLKPGLQNPAALEPLNDPNRCRVLRSAKTIIVDEISMVRSDLFCAIDARLRAISGGENRVRPFGGRQIILVGDFMQLPPVVASEEERRFLKERLGGVFAFETDLWQAALFRTEILRTIHRQQGDLVFQNVLNNLRHGNFDAAAKVLNNNCQGEKHFRAQPICLCTTNREAKHINEMERKRIKGLAKTFTAEVTGTFPESDYPVDACLEFVVGARVMVLCNQRKEGVIECVNGDRGTVTGFGSDDDLSVTVRLDSGNDVVVEPYTWEKIAYSYELDEKSQTNVLKQIVTGSFTQMPLRLAYAITIHKSQGLSLDAVDLRLGSLGCFDHGQLYTALSRCRSLEGLHIDRCVIPADLIVDDAVVKFYSDFDGQGCRIEADAGAQWYEEAMQYYLRRITTGSGDLPQTGMAQCEFDFSSRVYDHPDLEKLTALDERGRINKYDSPVLKPYIKNIESGMGVREEELKTISRLVKKYEA